MKIHKLDRWALELLDYNLNFIHIKRKHIILADTISCLKSKNLYHKPLQYHKTLHCQDISLITTKHWHVESTNTTELLIEEQKMNSVEHWQQNFTSTHPPQLSISHILIKLHVMQSSINPFYCKEPFMVTHKSKYSCKSVIYFDLGPDITKQNCKFAYYFNKTDITPMVLDRGNEIILADWPDDKHIICNVNNDIPVKIPSHAYVLVNRSVLCNCGIEVENNNLLIFSCMSQWQNLN